MSTAEPDSIISFPSLPPDSMNISSFFYHIFKKKEFTDVEFNLDSPDGPVTYSAHKIVLAIRSAYFADMLYGNQLSDNALVNIIPIQDVDPEIFHQMLRFFYDYTPTLKTPEQACDLFNLATRFQVTELINSCRQYLSRIDIVPSNVFHFLDVAKSMKDKSLTDRCLKLIQEQTRDVLHFYKPEKITISMMDIFLKSSKLSLDSEYEFIEFIFTWAKAKCPENARPAEIRDFLVRLKLLPDMHFLSLKNEEFAKLYRDHGDFFNKEEALSIFMNIAIPGSKKMPDWYDKESPLREYTGSHE